MQQNPAAVTRRWRRVAFAAALAMAQLARVLPAGAADDPFALLKALPNLPAVRDVPSPDGRFVLRAVEETDPAKDYRFTLVLETRATGGRTAVMPIHRNADIGWRADGERYFVNDNLGSNVADCEIHDTAADRPALSLADAANFARLFRREKDLDHLYFSCLRWTRQDEVEVVIHGHYSRPGAPAFRTRHLHWDIGTGNFRPAR